MRHHDNIEQNIKYHRDRLFNLFELTHHSYESIMEMPHLFFESYYAWKMNLEQEKYKKQKSELDNQQKLQVKLKAEQHQQNIKNKLKNR